MSASDLEHKHQFSPPDASGATSDPGSPSTLAPKPYQGRWLHEWLLKLALRWHTAQNIEQTQALRAGPHTMFLSALKNRSAWIQHMMCDIQRSVDGVRIILNCGKVIRKTERSMEPDKLRRRNAGEGRVGEKAIWIENISPEVWGGRRPGPRGHCELTPRYSSFPSTVPPLSSIIPTTRPLSLTAYGGLQSSAGILTGKHSAGHNAADKTRHLLVLLKQDHTICSSAPISQPPHRRLLKSSLQSRRFQVAYSSPPRVQSPHLCPGSGSIHPISIERLWRHSSLIWDTRVHP